MTIHRMIIIFERIPINTKTFDFIIVWWLIHGWSLTPSSFYIEISAMRSNEDTLSELLLLFEFISLAKEIAVHRSVEFIYFSITTVASVWFPVEFEIRLFRQQKWFLHMQYALRKPMWIIIYFLERIVLEDKLRIKIMH